MVMTDGNLIYAKSVEEIEQYIGKPKTSIIFHSKLCGVCKLLVGEIEKFARDGKLEGNTFVLVDVDKVPEAAKKYNITAVPYAIAEY